MNLQRGVRAAALCVVAAVAGCGPNYPYELLGSVALTVGADGDPTVLVNVCQGEVDQVRLYRIDPSDDDDRTRATVAGRWQRDAADGLPPGVHELAPSDPGEGWVRVVEPAPLDETGMLFEVGASGRLGERGVRGARRSVVTGEAVAALEPGQVLFDEDEVLTRRAFDAYCPADQPGGR